MMIILLPLNVCNAAVLHTTYATYMNNIISIFSDKFVASSTLPVKVILDDWDMDVTWK